MEDAAKALEEAKQEADEAQKTLEEVRATMVPNTLAEKPEEAETVLKLGLADVHDLRNLLHNLQARIHTAARRNGRPRRAGTARERARPSPKTTRRPTRSCTEPWATWVQSCKPTSHSRRWARSPLQPCLGQGRPAPTPQGPRPPPSCLSVCSSARRRHSSQHRGGCGCTDGRGHASQCAEQRHLRKPGSPWKWCFLFLLLNPLLIALSGSYAVGTAHAHRPAPRHRPPVPSHDAREASGSQHSLLPVGKDSFLTEVVAARLPHSAFPLRTIRQAQTCNVFIIQHVQLEEEGARPSPPRRQQTQRGRLACLTGWGARLPPPNRCRIDIKKGRADRREWHQVSLSLGGRARTSPQNSRLPLALFLTVAFQAAS